MIYLAPLHQLRTGLLGDEIDDCWYFVSGVLLMLVVSLVRLDKEDALQIFPVMKNTSKGCHQCTYLPLLCSSKYLGHLQSSQTTISDSRLIQYCIIKHIVACPEVRDEDKLLSFMFWLTRDK